LSIKFLILAGTLHRTVPTVFQGCSVEVTSWPDWKRRRWRTPKPDGPTAGYRGLPWLTAAYWRVTAGDRRSASLDGRRELFWGRLPVDRRE